MKSARWYIQTYFRYENVKLIKREWVSEFYQKFIKEKALINSLSHDDAFSWNVETCHDREKISFFYSIWVVSKTFFRRTVESV